jgi:metal-dependent hydrolase (beta-lactamase superfamily II)
MLIANMHALGIDPSGMDALVISHEHWDHVGGIDALLDAGARRCAGGAHALHGRRGTHTLRPRVR